MIKEDDFCDSDGELDGAKILRNLPAVMASIISRKTKNPHKCGFVVNGGDGGN